jgi:hypothetical protein
MRGKEGWCQVTAEAARHRCTNATVLTRGPQVWDRHAEGPHLAVEAFQPAEPLYENH